MNDQEALLILNALPDLGPVKINRLLGEYDSPDKIFRASVNRLTGVAGISRKNAETVCGWAKLFDLKRELTLIEKYQLKIVTIQDADYPALLREIYDPPVALYVRGEIQSKDCYWLAIVGARRASYYGLSTAQRLAGQLVNRGFTIVSGLARGVDTAAHQGALGGQGRTVAVLGCGVDRIYPPENRQLRDEIIKAGAVISEFPLGTPPYRHNFPKRNRIISGLCLGVVVVEAGSRSGSLITARLAAEQGREVFSVPGRIDTVVSQGTNVLIKHGARPVLELNDILEELSYAVPSPEEKKQDKYTVGDFSRPVLN